MRKQSIIFWFVIALAAIGVINGLLGFGGIHWSNYAIPILLAAIVFLLYKFPPKKYNRKSQAPKIKPSLKTMTKVAGDKRPSSRPKKKQYPFQVIEGSKGKSDDELPKYH